MDTYNPNKLTAAPKKVDISLRQLADFDQTGGDRDRVDNVRDNQVLVSLSKFNRPKTFSFRYISDILIGGNGVTISTDKDGITTISNSGVRKIIAGTNITISPVSGLGDVTINSTGGGGGVTSVTGTAPVVSSGGATPAISMPVATSLVNGYLSAADWATFNSKVPAVRTITINGTTQDLSADRTFTIATGLTIGTTPITSGTIGRVLFEGTGNVLQQSANLFWDNTNLRLDVIGKISTQQATFPAFAANGSVMVGGSNVSGTAGVLLGVQIPYVSGAFGGHTIGYSNQTNPKWLIGISRNLPQENALVYYEDSAAASARLAIFPGGNVGINTTTDAGFKLDVSGTARVSSTMGVGGAFVTGSSGFGNTILSLTSSYPCLILNSTSGTASKVGLNLDSSKLYISEETNGSLNWGHRIMVNTKVGGLVVLNNTAAGSIAALNASAVLQADSTTRGFLPPRMTTTQKNAIATPASGLVVYDTTLNTLNFYNGTTWADGSQVLPGNSLYLFYNY